MSEEKVPIPELSDFTTHKGFEAFLGQKRRADALETLACQQHEALRDLEKSCTQGMECGDWGFFTIEQWPELQQARAALAAYTALGLEDEP